jgi:hypothetical protein
MSEGSLNICSLEAFYLKHSTQLQATIENKKEFISNLLQIFTETTNLQKTHDGSVSDKVCERWSSSSIDLLAYVIDCIRICLRQKNQIEELVTREFIDGLIALVDDSATSKQLTMINVSTAALRCLTNLLNMNPTAVDLFLSLNGLTWLLTKLQNEGHIVHCYYATRLLYMLMSQRYNPLLLILLTASSSLDLSLRIQ